jgi:hypothetical protein
VTHLAARRGLWEVCLRLTIVTTVSALAVVAFILELLRRRQLREKYAIFWLVVGLVILPLAAFPRVLDRVAKVAGFAAGVSFVLLGGVLFLLVVCIHLSWEVSRLEDETRTLAEEVALIRAERQPTQPDPTQLDPADPEPTQREPTQREPTQRDPAEREPAGVGLPGAEP